VFSVLYSAAEPGVSMLQSFTCWCLFIWRECKC